MRTLTQARQTTAPHRERSSLNSPSAPGMRTTRRGHGIGNTTVTLNLLGYVAAALTTSAFIPQALKTVRSRDTRGISLWTYLIFTTGVALWFVYGLVASDWPIIVANAVTFPLAATVLILKLRHG